MKRRERAIISFIILMLLWGTILTGPFKYFAWMTRDTGSFFMSKIGAGTDLRVFVATIFSILCMVGLFLIGRSRGRALICAICAIASLCFYLIGSYLALKDIKDIQTIPLFIAIGLTLTLVAAVTKTDALEQWLADLFILSIPVMIIYDTLLVPFFVFLKIDTRLLAPWIVIPDTSLFMAVSILQWPVWVWGILVTAAALLPAVYFIAAKAKGKQY